MLHQPRKRCRQLRLYRRARGLAFGASALIAVSSAGCNSGPGAEFQIEFRETSEIRVEMLELNVTDGRREWHFDRSAFDEVTLETKRFQSATSGNLSLVFQLAASDASPISEGTFELELQPDWYWHITFRIAEGDPTVGCFGCARVFAFPIVGTAARSAQDSVWVVVGGNTLDNALVF